MRKAISLIVFLIVLGVGGYYVLQKYFPNLVPPSKDIKQYLPLSEITSSPIKIPAGNRLDTFKDLRGERPEILAFDPRGNLFVSLGNVGEVAALPDFDGNLRPEKKVTVLKGLKLPHGILFVGQYLYVAETNKVSRYRYDAGNIVVGPQEVLFTLPSGGKNATRNIQVYEDKLYTSVGSSCDACIETNEYRGTILVSDLNGLNLKVFAKGLRNPSFNFDTSGRLWVVDDGRDKLGDSLPPDEVNLVQEGKDYGWPYCYGNRLRDTSFTPPGSFNCDSTEPPVYELPAHSSPKTPIFDPIGNLLVPLNGSRNLAKNLADPKVIQLSVFAESIAGENDFISGLIQGSNEVLARPASLAYDKKGNLFIADNRSAMIYVLSK